MEISMKTIQLTNEDYEALMELSKELQLQANHSQAFPYFWEPASEKLEDDPNDEGEIGIVFCSYRQETYTLKEYAESNPEMYKRFRLEEEIGEDETYEDIEHEWKDWLEYQDGLRTYSQNWEQSTDHNPSLFLSDVKNYIEKNEHHLGRNPRTYARTVWRMPKMEKLIEILYRLNTQPYEEVNEEARRYVFKDK